MWLRYALTDGWMDGWTDRQTDDNACRIRSGSQQLNRCNDGLQHQQLKLKSVNPRACQHRWLLFISTVYSLHCGLFILHPHQSSHTQWCVILHQWRCVCHRNKAVARGRVRRRFSDAFNHSYVCAWNVSLATATHWLLINTLTVFSDTQTVPWIVLLRVSDYDTWRDFFSTRLLAIGA